MKSFRLRPSAIRYRNYFKTISAKEYDELDRIRKFILDYVEFEEKRKQLALALMEFDRFLLDMALESENSGLPRYQFFEDTRLRANLRSLSFLNSLTGLKDQFPKFNCIKKNIDIKKIFNNEWAKSKENSIAFHFCWKFRDVAQHHKNPIDLLTVGGEWDVNRKNREVRVAVHAKTEALKAKREVTSKEIECFLHEFGERADLSLIFRETAHEVSRITIAMRDRLSDFLKDYVSVYENFVGMVNYKEEGERYIEVELTQNCKTSVEFVIFDEFVRRARRLSEEKISMYQHRHFTSNRTRGHKQK